MAKEQVYVLGEGGPTPASETILMQQLRMTARQGRVALLVTWGQGISDVNARLDAVARHSGTTPRDPWTRGGTSLQDARLSSRPLLQHRRRQRRSIPRRSRSCVSRAACTR